jgi:hypothetical protein
MTGQEERMVVQAKLLAREFEGMATLVAGLRGKAPGRIERET